MNFNLTHINKSFFNRNYSVNKVNSRKISMEISGRIEYILQLTIKLLDHCHVLEFNKYVMKIDQNS